jgi:hypothetical protein
MEISIQLLLSSYCQELNQSWLSNIKGLNENELNYTNLTPFIERFREAEAEGYHFELIFCPLTLINNTAPNSGFEDQMMKMGNWRDIGVINNMLTQSDENNWLPIDAPLKTLRIEKIKWVAAEYLQNYVQENGVFFASKDPSTILVYCNMGSVAHELVLISIIHSKSIESNEAHKNSR